MEVDVTGLPRGGTRYSSTSSLSSAATASSPQTLQTTSTTSNIHNQVATAAVVCQTQGLNLAQSSRESPPASSSPGTPTPSIPIPAQVSSETEKPNSRYSLKGFKTYSYNFLVILKYQLFSNIESDYFSDTDH